MPGNNEQPKEGSMDDSMLQPEVSFATFEHCRRTTQNREAKFKKCAGTGVLQELKLETDPAEVDLSANSASAPEAEYEVEIESSENTPPSAKLPETCRQTTPYVSARSKLDEWRRNCTSLRGGRKATVFKPPKIRSRALLLLKVFKKQPRKHGLYQFVLWKEALKAAEIRVGSKKNIIMKKKVRASKSQKKQLVSKKEFG